MSKVIPNDVVGSSHWNYMATVMAKKLKCAVEESCLDRRDIPPGVFADAARFSNLVLSGELLPSGNSVQIALNAAKRALNRNWLTQEDTEKLLLGCCVIILARERGYETLDTRTIFPVLEFMSKFFSELSKMGEEERSARFGRNDLETGDDE